MDSRTPPSLSSRFVRPVSEYAEAALHGIADVVVMPPVHLVRDFQILTAAKMPTNLDGHCMVGEIADLCVLATAIQDNPALVVDAQERMQKRIEMGKAFFRFMGDAGILSDHSAYFAALVRGNKDGFIEDYNQANKRRNERFDLSVTAGRWLLNDATGPEIAGIGASLCVPFIGRTGYNLFSNYKHISVEAYYALGNYRRFGTFKTPHVFSDLVLDSVTLPEAGLPLIFQPKKLIHDSIASPIGGLYVITEDGDLILGSRKIRNGHHHSTYAAGRPVVFAGEFEVSGRSAAINNKTGHYRAYGDEGAKIAKRAFKKIGFSDVVYEPHSLHWFPKDVLKKADAFREKYPTASKLNFIESLKSESGYESYQGLIFADINRKTVLPTLEKMLDEKFGLGRPIISESFLKPYDYRHSLIQSRSLQYDLSWLRPRLGPYADAYLIKTSLDIHFQNEFPSFLSAMEPMSSVEKITPPPVSIKMPDMAPRTPSVSIQMRDTAELPLFTLSKWDEPIITPARYLIKDASDDIRHVVKMQQESVDFLAETFTTLRGKIYPYIIDAQGGLFVARKHYRINGMKITTHSGLLSRYEPVQACGNIIVGQRRIIEINNFDFPYPSGLHLRALVESNFMKRGYFEARGKYRSINVSSEGGIILQPSMMGFPLYSHELWYRGFKQEPTLYKYDLHRVRARQAERPLMYVITENNQLLLTNVETYLKLNSEFYVRSWADVTNRQPVYAAGYAWPRDGRFFAINNSSPLATEGPHIERLVLDAFKKKGFDEVDTPGIFNSVNNKKTPFQKTYFKTKLFSAAAMPSAGLYAENSQTNATNEESLMFSSNNQSNSESSLVLAIQERIDEATVKTGDVLFTQAKQNHAEAIEGILVSHDDLDAQLFKLHEENNFISGQVDNLAGYTQASLERLGKNQAAVANSLNQLSDQVVPVLSEIVDSLTCDSIKGFENELKIVRLKSELDTLKASGADPADIMRKSNQIKNEKTRVITKREKVTQFFNSAQDVVNIASALIKNPRKAREVAVYGGVAIQLGKTINDLIVLGTAAATGDLLSAASSIASCIGMIRGLKKEDPSVAMMRRLESIQQLIDNLCHEMHERFDDLSRGLDALTRQELYHFFQTKDSQETLERRLERFQEFALHCIESSKIENKESFSTLTTKLQTVVNRQRVAGRQTAINSVYTLHNRIRSPHALGAKEFVEIFNMLKTNLCDLDKNNIFLVGEVSAPISTIVKSLEEDADNMTFSADFNIATLHSHLTSLGFVGPSTITNPVLWCWQVMGLMELLQKRYRRCDEPEYYISHPEIKELESILTLAKDTQAFISSCQNEVNIEILLNHYISAGNRLEAELKKFIKDFEDIESEKLTAKWQENIDSFNSGCIDAFRQQSISIGTRVYPSWFVVGSSNHHPNFPNGVIDNPRQGTGHPEKENIYIAGQQAMIKRFQEEYIKYIREPLSKLTLQKKPLIQNRLNLYDMDNIDSHSYHGFIYPLDSTHPILPMLSHFEFDLPEEIAETLLQAEWLGLGHFTYRYSIEEINGSKQFVIHHHFMHGGQAIPLATLKTAYQPPEKYSGNEALWLFWVGGEYNANGAVTKTEYKVQATAETNVWHSYVDMPNLTFHSGRRNDIKQNESSGLSNANQIIDVSELSPGFVLVKSKIVEARQKYTQTMADALREKLTREDNSELSKALIAYSYTYYLLQLTLQLSLRDHPSFKTGLLSYFSKKWESLSGATDELVLFRNRQDFLSILAHCPLYDFKRALRSNLQHMSTDVSANFKQVVRAPDAQFHYKLLNTTLEQFEELINWYKNHAVDENNLVSSISKEAALEEQNEMQSLLLSMLGEAIVVVATPEQQKQMFNLIQQKLPLGIQGAAVSNLARAIAAPAASRAPNVTMAYREGMSGLVFSGSASGNGGSQAANDRRPLSPRG